MADGVDAIPVEAAVTLDGLFRERLRRTPDWVAYRQFDEASMQWRSHSWADTALRVRRWQAGLLADGLRSGDRVAVMAPNCWDWVAFDQAALGLGLIVVPLFYRDRPDSTAYVVNHSGARLLLIGDADLWKGLADEGEMIAGLCRIVCLKPVPDAGDSRVRWIEDWLPDAQDDLMSHDRDPKGLATIVYTSGTTGRPKGVMLSHHNILSNTAAGLEAVTVLTSDRFLSFLPLSHMFERTVGYYLPMMAGATVAYSRSIRDLPEDFKSQCPTILIAVPLVFERIYRQFVERLDGMGTLSQKLIDCLIAAGWADFEHAHGRRGWSFLQLLAPIARGVVGKALLAQLGGKLRMAVSGGAALAPRISRIFLGLGIPIIQGYGLTETSPVISVNRQNDNDPKSVGRIHEGVEVRVVPPAVREEGDDPDAGDIEVRGPNVMQGYWRDDEATRAVMTPDGWFKTGDRGRLVDGRLYIVGRSKEIIVLSNGEKAPPDDMEKAISLDAWFLQAVVVGENRPYLTAIVVLNPEAWRKMATASGLAPDPAKAERDDKSKEAILKRIERSLHDFPGYAKIRDAIVADEPWTVENGFLTPTLKKRRALIFKHYENRINQLYG